MKKTNPAVQSRG